MKNTLTLLRAVAVLACFAGTATAAVELQKLGWQMTPVQGSGAGAAVTAAKPIDSLSLDPGSKKLSGRLMGTLKLLNRGASVEGILLRYSVTGKIQSAEGGGAAVWVVPFMLETHRVPKAGPNQYLDVPLDATVMTDLYLKKLQREGYRLRELKLQVMLEPRRGATASVQVLEAVLPVEETARK